MHSQLKHLKDTEIELRIIAGEDDLYEYKQKALRKLGNQAKIPGFRKGSAPPALVEKNIDQQVLQNEFLDIAMSELYAQATTNEHIRPVTSPEISVQKFVPYTSLEFVVKTHVIAKIKLPNYKVIKLEKAKATVNSEDISGVLETLQSRMAERKEVQRSAKEGDHATIDFSGVDTGGNPVKGAEGKDYPLNLGGNAFIPGFEKNIEGMKAGEKKKFTLTFPKDYGVQALSNKKVTFSVIVKKVEIATKPEINDTFASKVGPFKTVKELKEDIKKHLKIEKQREIDNLYQHKLIEKIINKVELQIPRQLIVEQARLNLEEVRRNLNYKGQTYQEFLEGEGLTEANHMSTVLEPQAEKQVKTSLVLNEIAQAENLTVNPEELEVRIQLLKGQYQDTSMQAELDKPENRREIASRMLTEKVLQKLEVYASGQQ